MRALLSVATRDGITTFARGLQSLGIEMFATDGTREHLAQDGLEVKPVAELTGVPAIRLSAAAMPWTSPSSSTSTSSSRSTSARTSLGSCQE